jgi:hypothetical protein
VSRAAGRATQCGEGVRRCVGLVRGADPAEGDTEEFQVSNSRFTRRRSRRGGRGVRPQPAPEPPEGDDGALEAGRGRVDLRGQLPGQSLRVGAVGRA